MWVILVLAICALWTWACVSMARNRGRSPVTWGIMGFLFGLFAVAALGIAGDSPERRAMKEEAYRRIAAGH